MRISMQAMTIIGAYLGEHVTFANVISSKTMVIL